MVPALSSSSDPIQHPVFPSSSSPVDRTQKNPFDPQWIEFISRLLIEQAFFQNNAIPPQLLLHLANELISTLSKKEDYLDVATEVSIMWKQIRGVPLTAEEQKYDSQLHQIDLLGEVAKGIKYSTIMLIGQNLFSSIGFAIQHRLSTHIPSIAAYAGIAVGGHQGIAYLVDQLLASKDLQNLSPDQKVTLKPWLNLVGRLALGFVPKAYATEDGVHYHYPSLEGSTQTFSAEQIITIQDDLGLIQCKGLSTFDKPYAVLFRLSCIEGLSNEMMRIQVATDSGRQVAVEFYRLQGLYGPEIHVKCDDTYITKLLMDYFQEDPVWLILNCVTLKTHPYSIRSSR